MGIGSQNEKARNNKVAARAMSTGMKKEVKTKVILASKMPNAPGTKETIEIKRVRVKIIKALLKDTI